MIPNLHNCNKGLKQIGIRLVLSTFYRLTQRKSNTNNNFHKIKLSSITYVMSTIGVLETKHQTLSNSYLSYLSSL